MDFCPGVSSGVLLDAYNGHAGELHGVVVVVDFRLLLDPTVQNGGDHGAIVSVPRNVDSDVHAGHLLDLRGLRLAGPLCPLHRYEAVRQGPRELPSHTDTEDVAVLTEHINDGVNEVLVHSTGASPVYVHGVELLAVLVVAVIEKAGDLGGVPTHHQLGALGGQRTEDRLKYLIFDAGGLVDDVEDVVCMEALEGVRLAGRSSYGKPFLRVSFHVDLLFCPDQVIRQGRVVSQPLRNLGPQDVP